MKSDSCFALRDIDYKTQILNQNCSFPSYVLVIIYENQNHTKENINLQCYPRLLNFSLATLRCFFFLLLGYEYPWVFHIFISKISVQFPVNFQYCAAYVIAYNNKSCAFIIPLIPTHWIYNCQETTMPSYFNFSKEILFYCGFHSFPDVLPSLKETSLGDARLRWNIIISTY